MWATRRSWTRVGVVALVGMFGLSACKSSLGRCRKADLELLADELEAAELRARPDRVLAGLDAACRVSDPMRGYIDHLGPVGHEVPRRDLRSGSLFQAISSKAFRHACKADADTLSREMSLGGEARWRFVYAACELERLGLAGVDEPLPRIIWATQQWLLDQGLEPERARIISRALALADQRAYAPAGTYPERELPVVELPKAARGVWMALVHVTRSELIHDEDGRLLAVEDGRLVGGTKMPRLRVSLESDLGKTESMADALVDPPSKHLSIAADRETRLETLDAIVNTGVDAGFRAFGVVVEPEPFEHAALIFEPAWTRVELAQIVPLAEALELSCGERDALALGLVVPPDARVDALASALAHLWSQPCMKRVLVDFSEG